jgi:hypothetical protein
MVPGTARRVARLQRQGEHFRHPPSHPEISQRKLGRLGLVQLAMGCKQQILGEVDALLDHAFEGQDRS